MALTIRIFGRWTARADHGVWSVLEGPPEVAIALNAVVCRENLDRLRAAK
jgi:hypothetical protein